MKKLSDNPKAVEAAAVKAYESARDAVYEHADVPWNKCTIKDSTDFMSKTYWRKQAKQILQAAEKAEKEV
jgi:hypothetical protein